VPGCSSTRQRSGEIGERYLLEEKPVALVRGGVCW